MSLTNFQVVAKLGLLPFKSSTNSSLKVRVHIVAFIRLKEFQMV